MCDKTFIQNFVRTKDPSGLTPMWAADDWENVTTLKRIENTDFTFNYAHLFLGNIDSGK